MDGNSHFTCAQDYEIKEELHDDIGTAKAVLWKHDVISCSVMKRAVEEVKKRKVQDIYKVEG